MREQPTSITPDAQLTLRNFYRMLAIKDYPVYSVGVFTSDALYGQTLVKFWRDIFTQALPPSVPLDFLIPSKSAAGRSATC